MNRRYLRSSELVSTCSAVSFDGGLTKECAVEDYARFFNEVISAVSGIIYQAVEELAEETGVLGTRPRGGKTSR